MKFTRAFTLVEMLVVIAIITVLCALLLPTLNRAKANARRTTCLGNLKQVGLSVLMYSDDSNDKSPKPEGVNTNRILSITGYKKLIESYVGLNGASSARTKLFACPTDKYFYTVSNGFVVAINEPLHDQSRVDFSSYGFNGQNVDTNRLRVALELYGIDLSSFGVGGQPLSAIKNPSLTILLADAPAFEPFSWHQPRRPLSSENSKFNDAMNVLNFVDGHASYTKIFWTNAIANLAGSSRRVQLGALYQNPPAGYDYKWSRD